ncbi:hypothetical protein ACJ73_00754 [Blastomyces percursus]|uniref:Uncharacterized protein n=1 Tax=Blastomyces percursus TaxID=1658174 RepID=A0A1J9R671_9EURO|nr:hypothetical protein ACJ73_00754 [Blastomyces percursus]
MQSAPGRPTKVSRWAAGMPGKTVDRISGRMKGLIVEPAKPEPPAPLEEQSYLHVVHGNVVDMQRTGEEPLGMTLKLPVVLLAADSERSHTSYDKTRRPDNIL